MSQTINNRIQALRALFSQEGIQAFIIPSTDPHLSEYVAPIGNPGNGFPVLQVPQEPLSLLPLRQDYGPIPAISSRLPYSWKVLK